MMDWYQRLTGHLPSSQCWQRSRYCATVLFWDSSAESGAASTTSVDECGKGDEVTSQFVLRQSILMVDKDGNKSGQTLEYESRLTHARQHRIHHNAF